MGGIRRQKRHCGGRGADNLPVHVCRGARAAPTGSGHGRHEPPVEQLCNPRKQSTGLTACWFTCLSGCLLICHACFHILRAMGCVQLAYNTTRTYNIRRHTSQTIGCIQAVVQESRVPPDMMPGFSRSLWAAALRRRTETARRQRPATFGRVAAESHCSQSPATHRPGA